MNMTHPMPTDVTSFTDFLSYGNEITNSGFIPSVLLVVFTISFMISMQRKYAVGTSFAAASFLTAVLSVLFWAAGLLAEMWMILMVIIAAASIFIIQATE